MASEELLVTVGLSATKFKQEMKGLNSDLRTAEKNFRTTEQTASLMEKSTEAIASKVKSLTSVLEAQNSKITAYKNRMKEIATSNKELESVQDKLKEKLKSVTDEFNDVSSKMGKSSNEAKSLKQEMDGLAQKIAKNDTAIAKGSTEYGRLNKALESTQLQAEYTKSKLGSLEKEMSKMSTGKLSKSLKETSESFKKVGESTKSVGEGLTAGVTLPITAALGASVKFASDMTENINKVDVVFGKNAAAVKDWSNTTLTQFGISNVKALELAGSYGNLAVSMGFTQDKAKTFGTNLTGLAADMASLNNTSLDEAAESLNAIFTGEAEPMRKYGVNLTEANLQTYALSKGMTKQVSSMTDLEKIQLRYNMVMDKTKTAQGDFARSQDSTANQIKIFQQSMEQLATSIGNVLLPVINPLLQKLNEFSVWLATLSPEVQTVIVIIGVVLAAIGPLLIIIGQLSIGLGVVAAAFGALTAVSLPVIAAVAAIVAIFIALSTGIATNSEIIKGAMTNLQNKFIEAGAIIQPAIQGIWQTFQDVWNTVGVPVYDAIMQLTAVLVNMFAALVPTIASVFSTTCEMVSTIWSTILKPVFEFLMQIVKDVVSIVQEYMPQFSGIISDAWNIVRALWTGVLKPVFTAISPVISSMLNAIRPLWNSFKSLISSVFSAVVSVWNSILKPVFNFIVKAVSSMVSAIRPYMDTFKSVIEGAMKAVLSPIQWVIDKFNDLLGWIGKTAGKVGDFFSKFNPFSAPIGDINIGHDVNTKGLKDLNNLDFNNQILTPISPLSNSLQVMKQNLNNKTNSLLSELINLSKPKNKTSNNNLQPFNLNIENFNNNREMDIQMIAEELQFYMKKSNLRGVT